MPNWCNTGYVFHGSNEQLKIFHDKINEWTSKEIIKSDFGSSWLGNVVAGAGLESKIDNKDDNERIRCRGIITYISDIETDLFKLTTETAWSAMPEMWEKVIEQLKLDITFSFFAEECGCGYYVIYDPSNIDFVDCDYYVDSYLEGEINDEVLWVQDYCEISRKELLLNLQKTFNTDSENIEHLIERIEKHPFASEECYIKIHKIKHIESI